MVEVGVGSFPNAELYSPLVEACIIGVDPNDSNGWHAQRLAQRAGFPSNGNTLQIVHGVCEALPVGESMVCDLQSTRLGAPLMLSGITGYLPTTSLSTHTAPPWRQLQDSSVDGAVSTLTLCSGGSKDRCAGLSV